MALALSLGRRGQGQVAPNPAVGCVITSGGRIVGRGWTQPGGRPHAEVMALAQAGAAARGGTAYVTLEPCAHHGQTPPCANALTKAGIAHVVSAMEDPDPRVAGRGHDMLREAGVAVEVGLMAAQAARDNAGFFLRVQSGRPWITLKLAATLDGRIATASGESQWITGPAARRVVHAQRARHDAVLVGGGTARADDPLLTVRGLGVRRQPMRVVVSAGLDLPAEGAMAASAAQVPLLLLHGCDADPGRVAAWEGKGAKCVGLARQDAGGLDVGAVMKALGDEGLTRVFCEGGGQFAAALLDAGYVDEVIGFSAGMVFGSEGRAMLGALTAGALADAPRYDLAEVRRIGPDLMHRWIRPL
ncbi:bifunctional diaminohydroxyphosphoribosylaminopyrimidine deaminase/5-amino-6-(5-phosphoribosylamino)uracil reductase RibD [Alphaproteobacteria bacterium KMM 3653]|uniref:Riboflavin biosynthesis protein RibD n=2 Tax=Harenicola maris TaxID=2841044 RepID=A0AAP2G8Z3_9RHOB|nr:bifunctional diaminohydroxyphosphoribosylaminopyrimidine deaminase/5-amino-6-(5-phosphoribosylamino)uracil reductase RibD [Harenicola maris]